MLFLTFSLTPHSRQSILMLLQADPHLFQMAFLASSSIINQHNPIKCKYYRHHDHSKHLIMFVFASSLFGCSFQAMKTTHFIWPNQPYSSIAGLTRTYSCNTHPFATSFSFPFPNSLLYAQYQHQCKRIHIQNSPHLHTLLSPASELPQSQPQRPSVFSSHLRFMMALCYSPSEIQSYLFYQQDGNAQLHELIKIAIFFQSPLLEWPLRTKNQLSQLFLSLTRLLLAKIYHRQNRTCWTQCDSFQVTALLPSKKRRNAIVLPSCWSWSKKNGRPGF